MALFGVRGNPGDAPRSRRAVQRAALAPKKLSAASITSTGVPSASIVNLNRLTGERIHITGTPTITQFLLEKGEFRRLIFDDALTLVYDATKLLMPGNASIITGAGDACEAEGVDGTIVRLIFYQRGGAPPPIGATKTANVRLTLESGVPVSVTDQTSKTFLYATPYKGSYIPIYNGSSWQDVSFAELSLSTPFADNTTFTSCGTTNGSPTLTISDPAQRLLARNLVNGMLVTHANFPVLITNITAISSDGSEITVDQNATATGSGLTMAFTSGDRSNYDVFAVIYNGAIELRAVPWVLGSNTRIDAISVLNGLYVNTSATTQTGHASGIIATRQGTYLGTVVSDGSANPLNDKLDYRGVWNFFNRRLRPVVGIQDTDTFAYSTAAWAASPVGQAMIQVVRGLNEDLASLRVMTMVVSSGATGRSVKVGVGVDVTNANSAQIYNEPLVNSTGRTTANAEYKGLPGIGYHFFSALAYGGGLDTQTWSGDNGGTRQSGMSGEVEC